MSNERSQHLDEGCKHLYLIKPDERRFICPGVIPDNKQALMGLYCPYLVAIFFDQNGNLLDTQQRILPFMVEQIEQGLGTNIYDFRIGIQLGEWQEELRFQPAAIQVHKFFVFQELGSSDEETKRCSGIGIVDYPTHFCDVIDNPSIYTEDDRRSVQDTLRVWEENGQFVLWWGNDYWFDMTGECVAS